MTNPSRRRSARPAIVLLAAAAACAGPGPGDEPSAAETDDPPSAVARPANVLVWGRIAPDRIVLEPVFVVDAPPAIPPGGPGAHRLTGTDEDGATLFDLRFDGEEIADLPGGREEGFSFVVPVEAGAERLHAIAVTAADGRRAERIARLSVAELAEALEAGDAVSARRDRDGLVRVRWDGERFPMIMVREPGTGTVLAFGRGGETTVATEAETLEIAVSEGVRSSVLRLAVR